MHKQINCLDFWQILMTDNCHKIWSSPEKYANWNYLKMVWRSQKVKAVRVGERSCPLLIKTYPAQWHFNCRCVALLFIPCPCCHFQRQEIMEPKSEIFKLAALPPKVSIIGRWRTTTLEFISERPSVIVLQRPISSSVKPFFNPWLTEVGGIFSSFPITAQHKWGVQGSSGQLQSQSVHSSLFEVFNSH